MVKKEMAKLRIGLVGTSQLSFPGDKEAAFKACSDGMEKLADKLGFELVVYPETVIVREDAIRAVAAMESENIDFLLVQHTSYSAGQLAPVLAKIRNSNVGFWAIPEGAVDGAVPFNSLCSINMHMGIVAHYLRDYKIKVKWFFGYAEDEQFIRRLTVTVRALTAIKKGFDVVSMMYPDFKQMKEHLDNLEEQPFFLCEYTHGHGPCPAGLEEYWKLIYSSDKAMGGCVWQMCDHTAVVYNNDGTVRYLHGYGGDFDEGINDGARCANGFFDPERRPRAAAYRMKQVYRPIRAKLSSIDPLILTFSNKMDFVDTADISISYEVTENGVCIENGNIDLRPLSPHCEDDVLINLKNPLSNENEYYLNIYYRTKSATEWYASDYEVGFDQFALTDFTEYKPDLTDKHIIYTDERGLNVNVIVGNKEICFDKRRGGIKNITVDGHPFIPPLKTGEMPTAVTQPCHGPRLNFWRPPVVGDEDSSEQWYRYGYHAAEAHVNSAVVEQSDDSMRFVVKTVYGARGILPIFESEIIYTVSNDGNITVDCTVIPLQKNMPSLKRMGLIFELCRDFDRVIYFGSGEIETYPDAQEGAKIGLYNQKVEDLSEIDIEPQEMGNHCNVRYCRFYSGSHALTVSSSVPFNMNASHFTQDLISAAKHEEDLKPQMLTQVCVDSFVAPIGQFLSGIPEGEKPFDKYPTEEMHFNFMFELK